MKKLVFISLSLVLLLTSCENFLKASQVRADIEASIAYANAPSYTITIDGKNGVVKAPVGGQAIKKVTDTFALTFDAFTDYEFICWELWDSVSDTKIQNDEYLLIDSISSADTICTFKKSPPEDIKLCIKAVVTVRPAVISKSPTTTNGVIMDSSIQVFFDSEMSPYSIYYTDDELADLRKDPVIANNLLPDPQAKYIYGYIKNGETYFKNITITNKKNGNNLLDHFSEPVLENNNSTLIIKPKKNNPPDEFTQLLVCIEKGFHCSIEYSPTEKPKDVELTRREIWQYKVGNQRDSNPMHIVTKEVQGILEDDFTVAIDNSNLSQRVLPGVYLPSITFAKKNEQNKYELSLHINVEDESGETGPDDSFFLTLEKLYDGNYDSLYSKKDIEIDYSNVETEEASFDGKIDLLEEAGAFLTEGVYAISFNFKDKTGNNLTYPAGGKKYYFAIDETPIAIKPTLLEYVKEDDTVTSQGIEPQSYKKYKFNWVQPLEKDYKETIITVKDSEGTTITSAGGTNSSGSYLITFDNDNTYEITLEHKDYRGNGKISTFYFNRNALTQNFKTTGNFILFGDMPQSYVSSNNLPVSFSDTPVYNNWYLGSDGYFYELYSNEYYKVEPIVWRVACTKDNGTKTILLSEKILNANIPFYKSLNSRTQNKTIINPNDYAASTIREYLRTTFLQSAFTNTSTSKLQDTVVSFKAYRPTTSYAGGLTGNYTVTDKVFLADSEILENAGMNNSTEAIKILTPYAIAMNPEAEDTNCIGAWWINIPAFGTSGTGSNIKIIAVNEYVVLPNGRLQAWPVIGYNPNNTHTTNPKVNMIGTVPAICVLTSDILLLP